MSGSGSRQRGARQASTTLTGQLGAWLKHHRAVGRESLERLLRAPTASLLTWLVIGIALALPTGLLVGLNNLQALTGNWDGAARISLFMHDHVSEASGEQLARALNLKASVQATEYISREAALAEFQQLSGFGEVLEALPENPLTSVTVIPRTSISARTSRTSSSLSS